MNFGFGVLHGVQVNLVDDVSGPTVVPETSSTKLTYTPCKTSKPKYQYSSHGESLKSTSYERYAIGGHEDVFHDFLQPVTASFSGGSDSSYTRLGLLEHGVEGIKILRNVGRPICYQTARRNIPNYLNL
jgi:hypothetical protein